MERRERERRQQRRKLERRERERRQQSGEGTARPPGGSLWGNPAWPSFGASGQLGKIRWPRPHALLLAPASERWTRSLCALWVQVPSLTPLGNPPLRRGPWVPSWGGDQAGATPGARGMARKARKE